MCIFAKYMAKKRNLHKDSGELLMFSFQEMTGLENIEVESTEINEKEKDLSRIQKTTTNTDVDILTDEETTTLFDQERMIDEMLSAINMLDSMDSANIRLIAMETATLWHSGISLNGRYQLSALPNRHFDGYQFLALYYCSFYRAFPSMTDKLERSYERCYEEAFRRYRADEAWKRG